MSPTILITKNIMAPIFSGVQRRTFFLPGHRIRLEVSRSNFPRFDRNSNTGDDLVTANADQYRPAINRIFHDAGHPSHLILPLIEQGTRS
jgi:predicted acyl esterase